MNIAKTFLKINRIHSANLIVLWMLKNDSKADISEFIPHLSPKLYVIDGNKARPKKAMIDLLFKLSRMDEMAKQFNA